LLIGIYLRVVIGIGIRRLVRVVGKRPRRPLRARRRSRSREMWKRCRVAVETGSITLLLHQRRRRRRRGRRRMRRWAAISRDLIVQVASHLETDLDDLCKVINQTTTHVCWETWIQLVRTWCD
jgi:hypothetical protein